MAGGGLGLTELVLRGHPDDPDPDAAALIARMSVPPNGARTKLIDGTVRALKDSGVWAKLACCWLMAAHEAGAAALNWTGSGNTLAAVGSAPAFVTDRGFEGDGASQLLDTGLIPGTGQVLRDNHHLSIWPVSEGASSNVDIGAQYLSIAARSGSGTLLARSASASISSVANTIAASHCLVSRGDGASVSIYRDGALLGTAARVSSSFPGAYPIYLCGTNALSAGGSPGYSARRLAAATIGGGLDAGEAAALHAALSGYLAAVGAI